MIRALSFAAGAILIAAGGSPLPDSHGYKSTKEVEDASGVNVLAHLRGGAPLIAEKVLMANDAGQKPGTLAVTLGLPTRPPSVVGAHQAIAGDLPAPTPSIVAVMRRGSNTATPTVDSVPSKGVVPARAPAAASTVSVVAADKVVTADRPASTPLASVAKAELPTSPLSAAHSPVGSAQKAASDPSVPAKRVDLVIAPQPSTPSVSAVAATSGNNMQTMVKVNMKMVGAKQDANIVQRPAVVRSFTATPTEQIGKEQAQLVVHSDTTMVGVKLNASAKQQTDAATAFRGNPRLVPQNDNQGNSSTPTRAVISAHLAPSLGLSPLQKMPMHAIAHFLDRVEPAGLIHQKCSCEFRGLCSCQAAIEFMDCVAAACQAGECDCEETQFEHACTTISSECSTLEMECSVERATCLIEEATETYRLNRTVNDTYDDLRELKEQKCRLEVAEEDGWLNARPRLEVVEGAIAKKMNELKAEGAPLPEMHCEKHFEEWHPVDPPPVKSIASPLAAVGVCTSLLAVLLVGL